MGLFKLLGVLSPAHILFFTLKSRGKRIGIDQLGNKYYEAAPIKGYKRMRRWVMYKGATEASNVPPEWHGWLHHQSDVVPSEDALSYRKDWQKPHKPNMTGTNQAYRPRGHILSGGNRAKVSGDYEAWTPDK